MQVFSEITINNTNEKLYTDNYTNVKDAKDAATKTIATYYSKPGQTYTKMTIKFYKYTKKVGHTEEVEKERYTM